MSHAQRLNQQLRSMWLVADSLKAELAYYAEENDMETYQQVKQMLHKVQRDINNLNARLLLY